MKKKRHAKRTYKPEFKAAVVRRVLKGRATRKETQRAIADELGITEQMLSAWVRAAQFDKEKRALDENPPVTAADVPAPSIELKGLRAWVNHAVRLELDRLLALKGIK